MSRKQRGTWARTLETLGKNIFLAMVALILMLEIALSRAPRVYQLLLAGSVGFIATTFLNLAIKLALQKRRPVKRQAPSGHPLGGIVTYSYPSYHTQLSFTMVTIGSLFMYTHSIFICLGLLLLMMVISYSRIALRAHFPRDVVAGAIVGAGVGIIIFQTIGSISNPIAAIGGFVLTLLLFYWIPDYSQEPNI